MQLILSQPTTEDIKTIKMSTHTESPVNVDIHEIKQDINQVYEIKETMAALENSSSNESSASEISKEVVLEDEKNLDNNTNGNKSQVSKISKDIVLEEEKCLDNNTNGNELPVLEISKDIVIEKEKSPVNNTNTENKNVIPKNIKECDLLQNTNSIVSKIITNGTGCNRDAQESECKTQNLEITNEDVIVTNEDELVENKSIDPDLSSPNNSSERLGCFTKLEDETSLANTDESLCENNKILLDVTSDASVFVNVNVPINSLESFRINADDFKMDEISKLSEVIKDNSVSNTEKMNDDTKHMELTTADAEYPDDIVIDEEVKNLSEEPVDIETNNEPTLVEKEIKDIPLLDDEDVVMHEVNEIGNGKNSVLLESEEPKPTQMDEGVLPLVQTGENVISSQADVMKPLEIDREVLLSVQTCKNVILPEVDDPKPIEKAVQKLSPAQENSNNDQCSVNYKRSEGTPDATTAKPKATLEYLDDDIGKIKDDKFDFNVKNNMQETDVSPLNSTKICEENKVLDNNKSIDNVFMEIDDVETVNLEKEILEDNSNNISNKTSNEVVSKNTILEDIKDPEVTSVTVAEQKVDENIIISKDLESNEVKEKVESKISSEIINNLTTVSLEKSDTPEATCKNKNNSDDSIEKEVKDFTKESQENIEIIDEDDVKIVESDEETIKTLTKENFPERQETKILPVVCKLMNTLDILSDDEEEASNVETNKSQNTPEEKQCINLDDDDDIMLIEEDYKDKLEILSNKEEPEPKQNDKIDVETGEKHTTDITDLMPKVHEKDASPENISSMKPDSVSETENKPEDSEVKKEETKKPLLPQNFLKTAKKNLAGMTRHELEDFCILRIVESIIDRSNLSDIKTKIKSMAQNLEDYKKRAITMAKQNRDLQVVLKSVQEEQKKRTNAPIQPLKITRSVGMQVSMVEKTESRKKGPIPNPVQAPAGPTGRPVRGVQSAKQIKPPATPPNIPVPRKVPVSNSPAKVLTNTPANSLGNKSVSPNPNGLRNPSPVQKAPEKRNHSRMQASSVTVDLTDDEPPAKIINKNSPSQPVRVVPSQTLLAQQRQFPAHTNVPSRKVYIPISGPQGQNRNNQTYVMKNIVTQGPKPGQKVPLPTPRQQQTAIRPKQTLNRHPAPLPDLMKQYTPPTWKALPPAPDLKLSKVENGIVISWKIDGYPEGGYETIASYQLYAYQETTAPPCTALWKKIGDVKALPLPMACTLTQFMAGFKYYFAVRAVDIRTRVGPFSLPGSILLLNKV